MIEWKELIKTEAEKPWTYLYQDDFDLNKPQLNVAIDQKAADLGVSTEEIGRTLETIFGSKTSHNLQKKEKSINYSSRRHKR